MHVHERNPQKTLVIILLFVLVILIGFLTLKPPTFKYKLSLQQSIEMLHDSSAYFYPWQLPDVISKVNKDVVLIDIRNKFIFGQGHIPGAENISAYDLTNKEHIQHLKDLSSKTIVLYGEDQLQANGPWMWFRQVGFDNIKILLGGYDYYKANEDYLADSKFYEDYLKGVPKYDYAKVAASSAASATTSSSVKKPVVVKRKKKTAVAAGGC